MSVIILIAFAVTAVFVVMRQIPTDNMQIATIVLGGLVAMAGQVNAYWLGTSASSARKDVQLADAQAALATSVPASALPAMAAAQTQTDGGATLTATVTATTAPSPSEDSK